MIVVFMVVDSLRADAPGFAGGRAHTPQLDQIAREGTAFDDAFASGAWTIPSIVSMITGTYPHKVGICRWRHPLRDGIPNLFDAFRAAGFETRCYCPYPVWGFKNIPSIDAVGNSQDVDAVIEGLRCPREVNRFVFVHHWWTHFPYVTRMLGRKHWRTACDFSLESLGSHPEKIAPSLEAAYLRGVSHFSEELLGRYVDAATGGGNEVLLVLTGDHGENWGAALPEGRRVEHIFDLHGRWLTDETVRVPLLFWSAGGDRPVPSNQRIRGPVRGVDVGPTVAQWMGLSWPEAGETDGRSLAQTIRTGGRAPDADVWCISSHNTHVPDTYPEEGAKTWRTIARRTERGWTVFDAVDNTLRHTNPNGVPQLESEAGATEADHLRAVWRQSVDPGPLLPDPGSHVDGDAEEAAVKERLATLGYLD